MELGARDEETQPKLEGKAEPQNDTAELDSVVGENREGVAGIGGAIKGVGIQRNMHNLHDLHDIVIRDPLETINVSDFQIRQGIMRIT